MKKLEEIQSRKTMSAYGGVGSIIETKDNGSLLIDYYNHWGCFARNGNGRQIVQDERLLRYLQENYNLPITELRKIPTPEDMPIYWATISDLRDTMQSRYFPEWFYCRHCHRLHRLSDWETIWNRIWDNRTELRNREFDKNYPACPYCSNRRGQTQISRKPLEQIRFCMASLDSGKVEDIPFDLLFNATPTNLYYDVSNVPRVTDELEYRTSPSSDGLQANYVLNGGRGGQRLTMAAIESKYIIYDGAAYKLVLRNQNNIYYPQVVSAIFIPQDPRQAQLANDIMIAHRNGRTANQISVALANGLNPVTISPGDVQAIIDGQTLDFNMQEYAYITNQDNYINGINNKRDFYAMRYSNLNHRFIRKFYSLPRLREDSTIPCFCRISNDEKVWLDVTTHQESIMDPTYRMTFDNMNNPRNNPTFIPVVEAFGEGIFLDIDTNSLPQDDIRKSTFVHTFSHLIMKELEFECGYSLQSLKEKIYKKQDGSAYGILIYTIGGSEGSYGGLVSLLPNDTNAGTAKLIDIINNALERAKDCPNDPICSIEGGHCFACVDIPEISCCNWNKLLDRNVVNEINESLNATNTSQSAVSAPSSSAPIVLS